MHCPSRPPGATASDQVVSHGVAGPASLLGDWRRRRGHVKWFERDGFAVAVQVGESARWAERPDGSWIVVEGAVREAPDQLLDTVLTRGVAAAAANAFNGFLVVWNAPVGGLTVCRLGGVSRAIYLRADGVVEWSTHAAGLYRRGDRIDRIGVAGFMVVGAGVGRRTLVEDVQRVAPGEAWTFTRGGHEVEVVWRPSWDRPAAAMPVADRREVIRHAFTQVLAEQVTGVSRAGLLLSSGIDSVMVAVGLRRYVDVPTTAFTMTFEGYRGVYDEYHAAKRVSNALGIAHEQIRISPRDITEYLPWMVTAYGGPCSYGLHTSMLGSIVASGSDALFTGAGGDEWWIPPVRRWGGFLQQWMPRPIARVARSAVDSAGLPRTGRLLKSLRYAEDWEGGLVADNAMMGAPVRRALLGDAGRQALAEVADYYRDRGRDVADEPISRRGIYVRAMVLNPDFYGDWTSRWGRAYGLPVAVPFLDPRLADVLVVHAIAKADRAEFRSLAAEWVPEASANYPKVAQSLPLAEWLRGPLRPLVEESLAPDTVAGDGFFDPESITALWDAHLRGDASHPWQLWMAISLSYWKRYVFDPATV